MSDTKYIRKSYGVTRERANLNRPNAHKLGLVKSCLFCITGPIIPRSLSVGNNGSGGSGAFYTNADFDPYMFCSAGCNEAYIRRALDRVFRHADGKDTINLDSLIGTAGTAKPRPPKPVFVRQRPFVPRPRKTLEQKQVIMLAKAEKVRAAKA